MSVSKQELLPASVAAERPFSTVTELDWSIFNVINNTCDSAAMTSRNSVCEEGTTSYPAIWPQPAPWPCSSDCCGAHFLSQNSFVGSHVQKTLISWNKIVWSLSVLMLKTDKGAWDLVLIRRTLSALWFIKCCTDGGNEQKEPKTQKLYNPFLAWFWLLKVHVSWKLFGCLFHSLQMLILYVTS